MSGVFLGSNPWISLLFHVSLAPGTLIAHAHAAACSVAARLQTNPMCFPCAWTSSMARSQTAKISGPISQLLATHLADIPVSLQHRAAPEAVGSRPVSVQVARFE